MKTVESTIRELWGWVMLVTGLALWSAGTWLAVKGENLIQRVPRKEESWR